MLLLVQSRLHGPHSEKSEVSGSTAGIKREEMSELKRKCLQLHEETPEGFFELLLRASCCAVVLLCI